MASNSKLSVELQDGTDLIDETVLEQLARDTSVQAVPAMIGVFLEETQGRMAHIASAHSVGDLDAVKDEVHALKSTAGTFGALYLQRLARYLERACGDRRAEETERAIAAMPGVLEQTFGQLQAYCDRLDVGPD
ncbi:MAG: Hpt domain-containing protein [Gammaproteobacteria bacterium]|nr:Hpt domain-containing protein [Gammaproteobacteria bacterium]